MTDINFENNRILDVIDDNDEIVDSKSRIEIHELGLLHREIHVWMFDKDRNIFFQKRGLHATSAGLLDATVGGHVNQGEKYIDAAMREIEEESGIQAQMSDLVLINKLKLLEDSQSNLGGKINNSIRSIYLYKKAIDENMLTKEEGIPGGGFQKLSYDFLLNLPKEHSQMIKSFVLTNEIPDVLNYLSTWKN